MRDIFKLGGILFSITAIAAVLLGFTNMATADIIAEQAGNANAEALKVVLPTASEFEVVEDLSLDGTIVTDVNAGKENGEITGYAFNVAPVGYGGPINMLVGISAEGTLTGIEIVSHEETPGLGAKATEPEFKDQFKEKKADGPLTVGDIEAISGATITSTAVTDGVSAAIDLYNQSLK